MQEQENSVSNSSVPLRESLLSIKTSCDCVPKLLVVEDNDFNLMTVISIITTKYPDLKPYEAVNGLIAVNMFKT